MPLRNCFIQIKILKNRVLYLTKLIELTIIFKYEHDIVQTPFTLNPLYIHNVRKWKYSKSPQKQPRKTEHPRQKNNRQPLVIYLTIVRKNAQDTRSLAFELAFPLPVTWMRALRASFARSLQKGNCARRAIKRINKSGFSRHSFFKIQ